MPPRYCSTCAGFAARIASTIGSSAAVSETASCARYGSAVNPGSPRREIASSNAFRGIRSRASTSFASSAGVDDRRVDAGPDELVGDHVARGDSRPHLRRPFPPTAARARP